MKLYWNQNNNEWLLETAKMHVAGAVEKRGGRYVAGVAIPYRINKDGEEQDWQEASEVFDFLYEATAWVEENARWTVQGEFLNYKEIYSPTISI